MNQHNEIIFQSLNDYLCIDAPGFGILIKGDWGCGKSYFVKEWVKSVEAKHEEGADGGFSLKPIYVSFYGLKSTRQVDEAIKRAISPFLHGKFMQGVGKYAKLAASIAVRYNVDMDGDGNPEQVVCTLDPKMLLEGGGEAKTGKRLIIFDDLERSDMRIREVLGYVNYFVEQAGCYVVIVGDDGNIKDKEEYKKIKEKTIGHEYKIEAEIDAALEAFIAEIDKAGHLGLEESKALIKYCYQVTGKNNLRILRQALYDYRMFLSHVNEDTLAALEFKDIRLYLLANFITVYAEYKGGNMVMENFHDALTKETVNIAAGKDDEKSEKPATDTIYKYEKTGLHESHKVLTPGYVMCVMNYLLNGYVDNDFLTGEVLRDRSTPWEKLNYFTTLSNEDLVKNADLTAGHLENADFDKIDLMLMATCNLLTVIKKKLTYKYSVEKVTEWCLKSVEEKYFATCNTEDELYRMKNHAHRCLNYYQGESIVEEVNNIGKGLEDIFARVSPTKKNALTTQLESITDDKIVHLEKIYMGAIPDLSVAYSSYAIFSQVDANAFVSSFVKLSNEGKVKMIQFVRSHYHQAFAASNADEFVHYYEADLNVLPEIVKHLREQASGFSSVEKLNIETMADALTEAGDTIQMLQIKREDKKKGNVQTFF